LKPEGEACNPDGTLKDAEQIEWLNSPSDIVPPSFENQDKHNLDNESDDDHITKKHQVQSINTDIISDFTPAMQTEDMVY